MTTDGSYQGGLFTAESRWPSQEEGREDESVGKNICCVNMGSRVKIPASQIKNNNKKNRNNQKLVMATHTCNLRAVIGEALELDGQLT